MNTQYSANTRRSVKLRSLVGGAAAVFAVVGASTALGAGPTPGTNPKDPVAPWLLPDAQERGTKSLAAAPRVRVSCVTSKGWMVDRVKPKGCNLSLTGSASAPLSAKVRLRNMRWTVWNQTKAVGVGTALSNRQGGKPYRVRVTLWRRSPDVCGRVFTRGKVVSSGYSTGARVVGGC